MKLLFDENLSRNVAKRLRDVYPGTVHVADLSLLTTPDREIWHIAGSEGFTIVTKDIRFEDLAGLLGSPPKLILMRIGAAGSRVVEKLLRDHIDMVAELHANEAKSVLVLPPPPTIRKQESHSQE